MEDNQLPNNTFDDDKIVIFQTYTDPINAHIVKGLLESNGIRCFLTDENIITVNTLYAQAVGGVKLNVFEKDIQIINVILASEVPVQELAGEDKSAVGIVCPNCHSLNVAYGGSVKRKFTIWNIVIAFVFMIYPFYMRKAFHCFDCDYEFKKV